MMCGGQMIQFMSVNIIGERRVDMREEDKQERNRFDKSEAIKHIWIKDPHKLFYQMGKIKENIQRAVRMFLLNIYTEPN